MNAKMQPMTIGIMRKRLRENFLKLSIREEGSVTKVSTDSRLTNFTITPTPESHFYFEVYFVRLNRDGGIAMQYSVQLNTEHLVEFIKENT